MSTATITFDQATDKQLDFIATLASERDIGPDCRKREGL